MLHLGTDSFCSHLASHYNVPLCCLYSCSPSSISGPYFGDKSKHTLFDAYKRVKNGKPSYAAEEPYPKSINSVFPEEIANAVFKLLNIDFKCPFETVYIGEKYCNQLVRELIPNFNLNLNTPNVPIEVRMDLHFDEKTLAQQLQISKCVVITNKPVNLDLLRQFKSNIIAVVYEIGQDDQPEFIKNLRSLGIQMLLVSYLSQDEVNAKKINYYEIGKINKIEETKKETIDKLKGDLPNLYYQANKILASEGQFYMTNAGRINNQPIQSDFSFHKFVDCAETWRDLPFIHVIKKTT